MCTGDGRLLGNLALKWKMKKVTFLGLLGTEFPKIDWVRKKRLISFAHTDVPNIFTWRHERIQKRFFWPYAKLEKYSKVPARRS